MSGRLFQGVIHQMKDTIERTIGVIDENGAVIACSDLMKIGETRQAVKEELIYSAESVVYSGYTYRPMATDSHPEYIVFVEGEDIMADKRFEKVYSQGTMNVTEIWVDKETGVNYLFRQDGYAGGLTPLLDREGKPVISNVSSNRDL